MKQKQQLAYFVLLVLAGMMLALFIYLHYSTSYYDYCGYYDYYSCEEYYY